MDIFFHDPEDIPLPPNEVHIRALNAQPYPDGRRVKVYLEISPFQKRPNGELTITNETGREIASISFIETIDPKLELTMHIRTPTPAGSYTLKADLFYEEPVFDEDAPENAPSKFDRTMIDHAETSFTI